MTDREREYYAEIGQKIKAYRQNNGLTQQELAEKIQIKQPFLAMVEAGKKVSMYRIVQMFEAMGFEYRLEEKKHRTA